ncbi:membrane protease YdiL (CAAX protease family) [Chryseobacterium sp. SLBN-27]|jgi:membrane protease YdiL (CAAX protease family)|uniref:CPBP family intramembrane glutamic endopeptidase n=1 Tax=Chryseobacterium sp. SLBN-27 TaxID=3042287 RepID=UPI0028604601|nr:type II CAAX endopeptidase family protein [Chryseobacterium sp. SLBN-27]MDR6157163.1 membrane protease YdiL (CAAX protease family) [Chryseobacterium sp. SLBN-27]
MSLTGKYSIGILFTFILLAGVMLYVLPVMNTISETQNITAEKFFYSRVILWIVLLLIFFYSLFTEKGPFLFYIEKKYPFLFYAKAVIVLYLICCVGATVLNVLIQTAVNENLSPKLAQLQSLFRNNYFLIIFTCLSAGVVEELLMRGYIQSRVEKIYGNQYFGIFVSAILFGILHSTYGTLSQVLIPLFIGIVFAMFYKLYSNIKILIICHFMYDFISLMIMNFVEIKNLSAF